MEVHVGVRSVVLKCLGGVVVVFVCVNLLVLGCFWWCGWSEYGGLGRVAWRCLQLMGAFGGGCMVVV